MCGIVGILGKQAVAGDLVDALRRLEYRGYDSAGIATIENGRLDRRRAEGKLKNLELRLSNQPLQGHTGLGHTRWATHGRPVERNAHPHMNERVAVVHNGIIENFQELRDELSSKGHVFQTETDTETILHLVSDYMDRGLTPTEAAKGALQRLRGAFALAIIFAGEDNLMIGARQGPPLAIGHGQGEMYLGSDAIALAPFTDTITYLEDGDCAVLSREKAEIFAFDGRKVDRPAIKSVASSLLVDKGNFRHFMAKEIHEQPEVIGHTLANYVDLAEARVVLPELGIDPARISQVSISACGTAYYAGIVGKYWLER
jgi:glucosamine--fructose-6-phosphate aminotransferase (isomerizing)